MATIETCGRFLVRVPAISDFGNSHERYHALLSLSAGPHAVWRRAGELLGRGERILGFVADGSTSMVLFASPAGDRIATATEVAVAQCELDELRFNEMEDALFG